jgi:two-component system sensor histidine kinase KdpD
MGPGTGRYEEQPAWYLPMRGRGASPGAALLRLDAAAAIEPAARAHAQALCDQMGLALERAAAIHAAAEAREAAQAQALRSTVLAAIAHDHRTPLATILGAASSLHDQDDRLAPEQRRRLAATIVDEAAYLARLTENALQLARLDASGLELALDWESAEELVGAVVRRLRQRYGADRISARLDAGLPLLRCDAVLIVQLLDNLVDNAIKHGGAATVEIDVSRAGDRLVFSVADRGPGVPVAERERIFEIFRRGDAPPRAQTLAHESGAPRGAGVGLAVCRAIARAHGGEVVYRPRDGGGSRFDVALPLGAPPEAPGLTDDAPA